MKSSHEAKLFITPLQPCFTTTGKGVSTGGMKWRKMAVKEKRVIARIEAGDKLRDIADRFHINVQTLPLEGQDGASCHASNVV